MSALAARLLLAGVFALAAVAKLADRPGTRNSVIDFGAPARSAGALSAAIPLAELAVVAMLLPAETALAGAICALVLLALFTGVVAVSVARGRAPDCHCFGQLHSAPTTWRTIARNGVLIGVAVVAIAGSVAEPDTSATAWIGRLGGAELLAVAVALTALAILVLGSAAFITLMRSYGRVLVRMDRMEAALAEAGIDVVEPELELGLEPGTPAPAFVATTVAGETVSLESLTATGLPSLVVFTSPHCGPCKALLPKAAAWQEQYAGALTLVFASDAPADEARAEAEEFELVTALLDTNHELYDAYGGNGTPSAVLIAPDGTVGSWLAAGADAIERLVERAATAQSALEPSGLPVGSPAPAITLSTLDGRPVALDEAADSLILFWNPECGFCRSMHQDLLAWEKAAPSGTPRLLVVSSGDVEAVEAEGFESTVLLDPESEAGTAFHADGTPMAVLLDADGRVAAPLAAGAEAVFALATGRVAGLHAGLRA